MMTGAIYATTYFSNNVMLRHQLSLSRAITLIDHACAIIPPDAGLLEIRSPSQVMLVPDRIISTSISLRPACQPTARCMIGTTGLRLLRKVDSDFNGHARYVIPAAGRKVDLGKPGQLLRPLQPAQGPHASRRI
jgi:hypothetical protein